MNTICMQLFSRIMWRYEMNDLAAYYYYYYVIEFVYML